MRCTIENKKKNYLPQLLQWPPETRYILENLATSGGAAWAISSIREAEDCKLTYNTNAAWFSMLPSRPSG